MKRIHRYEQIEQIYSQIWTRGLLASDMSALSIVIEKRFCNFVRPQIFQPSLLYTNSLRS